MLQFGVQGGNLSNKVKTLGIALRESAIKGRLSVRHVYVFVAEYSVLLFDMLPSSRFVTQILHSTVIRPTFGVKQLC